MTPCAKKTGYNRDDLSPGQTRVKLDRKEEIKSCRMDCMGCAKQFCFDAQSDPWKLKECLEETDRVLDGEEDHCVSGDCRIGNRLPQSTVLADAAHQLEIRADDMRKEIDQLKVEPEQESCCRLDEHNEMTSVLTTLNCALGTKVRTCDTTHLLEYLQSIIETLNAETQERATDTLQLREKIEAETKHCMEANNSTAAFMARLNASLGQETGRRERADSVLRTLITNMQQELSVEVEATSALLENTAILVEATQGLEKHAENVRKEIGQLQMEFERESRCCIDGHNELTSSLAILNQSLQSITDTLNAEAQERATDVMQLREKIEVETKARTEANISTEACIARLNANLGQETRCREREDTVLRTLIANIQQELSVDIEGTPACHDANHFSENTAGLAEATQEVEKSAEIVSKEIGQLKMEFERGSCCCVDRHDELTSSLTILKQSLQSISETLNAEAHERATDVMQLREKIEAEVKARAEASISIEACIVRLNANLAHETSWREHEESALRKCITNLQKDPAGDKEVHSHSAHCDAVTSSVKDAMSQLVEEMWLRVLNDDDGVLKLLIDNLIATTEELEKHGEGTRQMLVEQTQSHDAALSSIEAFVSENNQKMTEQINCCQNELARIRGCLHKLATKFSFFVVMQGFLSKRQYRSKCCE